MLNLELRLISRSISSLVLVLLVGVLCLSALLAGQKDRAEKNTVHADFMAENELSNDNFRNEIIAFETGSDVTNYTARPMLISEAAVLPDGVLGDFSIGSGDLFPSRVRVRLWESTASLFDNYQFENPTTLQYSRLDLTTVVIMLMPLLMIAISFDSLGSDRDSGRLRMLLVSGESERKILTVRLFLRNSLLWLPLVLVTFFAMLVNSVPGELGERSLHYLCWLGGAILYGAFWIFCIGAVIAICTSAARAAAILFATWAIIVLILPAITVAMLQTFYPSPSQFEYLSQTRAATATADQGASQLLESYAMDNPELQFGERNPESPYRDGYLRARVIEEATAPLRESFTQSRELRSDAVNWIQLLSPAIATEELLATIGGGHTSRYLAFQEEASQHLAQMSAQFGPAILAGDRVTLAEYDNRARLTARGSTLADNQHKLLVSALILLGFMIMSVVLYQLAQRIFLQR